MAYIAHGTTTTVVYFIVHPRAVAGDDSGWKMIQVETLAATSFSTAAAAAAAEAPRFYRVNIHRLCSRIVTTISNPCSCCFFCGRRRRYRRLLVPVPYPKMPPYLSSRRTLFYYFRPCFADALISFPAIWNGSGRGSAMAASVEPLQLADNHCCCCCCYCSRCFRVCCCSRCRFGCYRSGCCRCCCRQSSA